MTGRGIEETLREILKRGNNAEVRQDKDGRMVIYEVEKKKRYIDDV
jgi:sulfite reductase alpha subunit-like flavoprotein